MADSELAKQAPDNTPVKTGFDATRDNIELLKNTLAGTTDPLTDNELQLVIYQATRTGLDPLSRQIYPMKNKGRLTFITSIDGYRLIAERTGKYRGQVGPFWCGEDGEWKDVWLAEGQPAAAKVGVLKDGNDEPTWGVARFKSYNKGSGQWPIMGDVMIAKCAEALALRKAFPHELGSVYTQEEMDQAEKPKDAKDAGSQLMTEASDALRALGVEDANDRKAILLGAAGVKDMSQLTVAKLQKALKEIADVDIQILKDRYTAQDGQVIDGEEVQQEAPKAAEAPKKAPAKASK